MNRYLLLVLSLASLVLHGQGDQEKAINEVLDSWHRAAGEADFDAYFGKMTESGVFIGTDATENWDKQEFMEFSKPYFDRGKAWDFTPLERHVFIDSGGRVAWFDELLDTWMQLCRGSGVLVKEGETWKISHYVLSLAIPNDAIEGVIELKQENDSIVKSSILLRQPN